MDHLSASMNTFPAIRAHTSTSDVQNLNDSEPSGRDHMTNGQVTVP